ncbi:hypothetical protein KGO95_03705 [Patescibacteria group bacterium]|nr:hypothetical protein [Patescibacteria group bacterium]
MIKEMTHSDILIVGGGLAGLGCAKHLHDQGESFMLVTDTLGGRVKRSPDGKVNYGAYYVTKDCVNIMPYITKVRWLKWSDYHFHRGSEHYHIFSPRLIKHIPAALRLFPDLYRFRRHFNKLRRDSLDHPRKELIEKDPYLSRLYHMKAAEYIKEKKLEAFVKEYLEQILWASFFHDPYEVQAAYFVGSLLPIIIPSYSFEFRFDELVAPFKDVIMTDTVTKVTRTDNGYTVLTKKGDEYSCRTLVLATPMTVTNQLVPPQKIKGTIDCSYYHIRGEIKPEYDVRNYNFFSLEEASLTAHEADGTYLYFYTAKDNIHKYFNKFEVITKDTWHPALFFLGDEYVDMHPAPNLFLANDHNVASTEDAFINGIYAAKTVLRERKKS